MPCLRLGELGLSLRELKLEHLSLAPDFLFPLDQDGHPLASSTSLHWPYLEKLNLGYTLPISPSGQWLVHPTPKDQAELDAIEDMEETIFNPWAAVTDLPIFETEHFHRVLISLGHAARRMPLLICMIYDLDHEPRFLFVFHTRSEVGHGDEWGLESPYHIDERVAGAWGCPSLLELEAETEADEEKVLSKVVEWPLK